ncbi:MAG: phosphoglycerate kinase [Clostridiaceae bacterium]|nr:phosphoglycerate kinase [Clostridiaceae bacterium]
MNYRKKSVRDVDVSGKRVLVRCDFNVPQDANGKITDDIRIRAALPTIRYLLEKEAAVILCSHLGRPKGKADPKYSLAPVARRLSELLQMPVELAPDVCGESAKAMAAALRPGRAMLLENVRFCPGEEKNDPVFAKELASLADLYVNDAFGTAHRAHASTAGVADYLPAVCGFLMQKEIDVMGKALDDPKRPFVAVLGGAKVSDKLNLIDNLLGKCDSVLVCGGMAFTFIKAQGGSIGESLCDDEKLELCRGLLKMAEQMGKRLLLPTDTVAADAFAPDAKTQIVPADAIPDGWRGLDVGPETVKAYGAVIADAGTVVWNGPAGVFEMPAFARGTEGIARAVAESGAISIIGGGDSAAAMEQLGYADRVTHMSTGGGASLEFLEGRELPGVICLQDA